MHKSGNAQHRQRSMITNSCLQLMKALVLAESSGFLFFIYSFKMLYAPWQSADMSQVDVTPFSPF